MRNMIAFAFFYFILHFPLHAMETPAEEKTWTWEIFHIIDQWTDPLSYFTDPRAPKICDDVMRFGLPSTDANYREYTGDAQCLDDVKSALKRQRALINSLETECLKDSGSKVELLRDAYDRQKEYYSQNILALIESYLERSTNTARNTAHILDKQAGKILEQAPVPTHLSAIEQIDEARAVTYKTIEELVTGNPGIWGNTVNYVRKNYVDPLKYLNDEKAQSISLAMRYLHPRHKFHTEQWQFNNKLDFHKKLIHQALEREIKLTQALQHALQNKKSWMIVSINPENPDLKSVMVNIASSYSPIVCAIIKGYLTSEAHKKEREVKEKEKKDREQKELTEKNTGISTMLNALGRKFSDAGNKDKLISHRAKFNEARCNIMGRSLNSQEILAAHTTLTEISKAVEVALQATPTQTPLNPLQSTSVIPNPPSSPVALEPKPVSTAASLLVKLVENSSTVAPTALSEPVILPPITLPVVSQAAALAPTEPPTKSVSHSPSASVSEAVNPASNMSSPQASPPHTPDGSLVIPNQDLKKSDTDDFNPREVLPPPTNAPQAKNSAVLAPVPTQTKQPIAKQGKKNKS